MENASKALIMAGGVLVGILILSLAVYLFADFGSTVAKINDQKAEQEIVEFNSRFTSYEGFKDKNGEWQITVYDIISLAGYAKEYNKYYQESNREKISVNITGIIGNLQNEGESKYQELIDENTNAYGETTKFSYSSVSYDNEGRVKAINFKKE